MPLNYSLFLTNQARKELAKIRKGNPKIAQSISSVLDQLQQNPNLGIYLHGDLKGRRKIRVGEYRIIYDIKKNELVIFILRIAHRKEAYR